MAKESKIKEITNFYETDTVKTFIDNGNPITNVENKKKDKKADRLRQTVNLPMNLVEKIDAMAKEQDRPRGSMIRIILEDYFSKQ